MIALLIPQNRFTSKDYGEPLGHFITSVNGLNDDIANEKFWGFLLRRPINGDCKLPVGQYIVNLIVLLI